MFSGSVHSVVYFSLLSPIMESLSGLDLNFLVQAKSRQFWGKKYYRMRASIVLASIKIVKASKNDKGSTYRDAARETTQCLRITTYGDDRYIDHSHHKDTDNGTLLTCLYYSLAKKYLSGRTCGKMC